MSKFLDKIGKGFKGAWTSFISMFSEVSPTSLMRFMSFFIFWFAMFETHVIISTYGATLTSNHIFLIVTLFGFAFFPKVIQKAIEKKYATKDKELDLKKEQPLEPTI